MRKTSFSPRQRRLIPKGFLTVILERHADVQHGKSSIVAVGSCLGSNVSRIAMSSHCLKLETSVVSPPK